MAVALQEDVFWPNGLTIDYDDEAIFWADAKLNIICSAGLDGRGRRTVSQGDLQHPFALTLYKNWLYWTDWQTKSIHTCNKKTGLVRWWLDLSQPVQTNNVGPRVSNAGPQDGAGRVAVADGHPRLRRRAAAVQPAAVPDAQRRLLAPVPVGAVRALVHLRLPHRLAARRQLHVRRRRPAAPPPGAPHRSQV